MSEQRIQTVKIVWKGDDAKQKAVEFTRSIKGTDKAVEDLNKTMGENATVTAQTTLSAKERTAIARKEFTAANRLVTKYNNITSSLRQQSKMYGMTDEAAEIYTAQMRLGANATKAQKDEIARLVTGLQAQRTATGQTTGSMRNMRGQAQNLGWQMQDVAVQMQMGTDSMVIFSQQGSQLASGFGPTGAIVGALIAVGGAIAGVALSTKQMAEAQKIAKVTTVGLTEKMYEQAKAGKALSKEQRTYALIIQDTKIKNYHKEIEKQKKLVDEQVKALAKRNALEKEGVVKRYGASAGTTYAASFGTITEVERLKSELSTLEKDLATAIKNRENLVKGAKFEDESANEVKKETIEFHDAQVTAIYKEIEARKKLKAQFASQVEKLVFKLDPVKASVNQYDADATLLEDALGKKLISEREYVNASLALNQRHAMGLQKFTDQKTKSQDESALANAIVLSSAVAMVSSTVDIMSNGAEKIKAQTAEMNAFQKGMFLTTQALAASMAVINGITIGMNLAKNQSVMDFTGLSSAAMVTFGTSLGAAQAGAIMGTTFAGMFDQGGTIPNGQAGVVAERYDEMVGGTMVYNNSGSGLNVTGSKDTAAAVGGGNMFVEVHNTASNTVTASVQQVDENRVKIMIAEHFTKNIDKGVSGVISKNGSKTDKAMRNSYNTQRKY